MLVAGPPFGVEDRLKVLIDQLAAVVAVWERALAGLETAVARRDAALSQAEVRLRSALHGMTLRRWRSLVSGKAAVRSSADGRALALARRLAPAVEAALGDLEGLRAARARDLWPAQEVLAVAAAGLLRYGPAAEAASGRPVAELRRMARSPNRPGPSVDG